MLVELTHAALPWTAAAASVNRIIKIRDICSISLSTVNKVLQGGECSAV